METGTDGTDRLGAMQARVDALSATLKSVLSTLVLRGLLNKADVAVLLRETEAAMGGEAQHPAGRAELRAIEAEVPAYLRAAVGPAPDEDHDDH